MKQELIQYYFSVSSPLTLCLTGAQAYEGPWAYFYSIERSAQNVCYEVEWERGDGYPVFGFVSENDIRVSYFHCHGSPVIGYTDIFAEQALKSTSTNFKLQTGIPALVCINIKERLFTIIQEGKRCESSFPQSFNPKNVRVTSGSDSQKKNRLC